MDFENSKNPISQRVKNNNQSTPIRYFLMGSDINNSVETYHTEAKGKHFFILQSRTETAF